MCVPANERLYLNNELAPPDWTGFEWENTWALFVLPWVSGSFRSLMTFITPHHFLTDSMQRLCGINSVLSRFLLVKGKWQVSTNIKFNMILNVLICGIMRYIIIINTIITIITLFIYWEAAYSWGGWSPSTFPSPTHPSPTPSHTQHHTTLSCCRKHMVGCS